MIVELTNFMTENTDLVATIVLAVGTPLVGHFGASVVTAVTKTRNSKWYKLIEAMALVTKKVKEEAKK